MNFQGLNLLVIVFFFCLFACAKEQNATTKNWPGSGIPKHNVSVYWEEAGTLLQSAGVKYHKNCIQLNENKSVNGDKSLTFDIHKVKNNKVRNDHFNCQRPQKRDLVDSFKIGRPMTDWEKTRSFGGNNHQSRISQIVSGEPTYRFTPVGLIRETRSRKSPSYAWQKRAIYLIHLCSGAYAKNCTILVRDGEIKKVEVSKGGLGRGIDSDVNSN